MLGRVGKVGRLGSIGGLEGIPAPDLQLNFDQASIGANAAPDDAIDFSRASQATFTDSDGLVKYAPHNLCLQSEDLSTTWTVAGSSISANNATAPDGTTTADKIVEDTSTGAHTCNISLTSTDATGFTSYSAYFKADGRSEVVVRIDSATANYILAVFNFSTETISSQAGNGNGVFETSSMTDVGNGWFRVTLSGIIDTANSTIRVLNTLRDSGSGSYTGDGSSGLLMWGVQISKHRFVPVGNPYIKTTTAAVYGARLDHEAGYFLSANQAQNLVEYSEQLDNAYWTIVSGVSVSANQGTSPDGTTTADKFIAANTSRSFQALSVNISVPDGSSNVFSIYAKADERDKFALREGSLTGAFASFDLTNGTVITDSSATASIEDDGDGWFRCSIQTTVNDTFGVRIIPLPDSYTGGSVTDAFSDDGTSGVLIWGAQLEVGSSVGTYVKTEGLPYYGGGATQNGLLIEEQRVNLLTYSEDFTDSSYTSVTSPTLVDRQLISPFGLNQNTYETTTRGGRQYLKTIGVTTNSYTASVFVKRVSGTTNTFSASLGLAFGTSGNSYSSEIMMNLNTGASAQIRSGTPDDYGFVDYGNGWYRIFLTLTDDGSGSSSRTLKIIWYSDADTSGTGYSNRNSYIFGMQFEQGAFPTSYIPTSGSTVTRSADLATMGPVTGTNLILQSEDLSTTWASPSSNIATDQTTSPDGLTTADKVREDNISGVHYIYQNMTLSAARYQLSIYAKAAEREELNIAMSSSFFTSSSANATFHLGNETAVVAGIGEPHATITDVGDGWYRLAFGVTTTQTATGQAFQTILMSGGSTSYSGDGTSGLFLWGAQLEQAPTLITDAEDLSGHTLVNATQSANVIAAPDGNTTADKLVESTSGGQHALELSFTAVGNKQYTASVFVKHAGDRRYLRTTFQTTNGIFASTGQNAVIIPETGGLYFEQLPSSIEDFGNGWYRWSVTATAIASGTGKVRFQLGDQDETPVGKIAYTGDGSSGVYLWGMQVEEGASATPYPPVPTKYLPTHASTDLPFVGYNLNEGTIEADFEVFGADANNHIYYINDGGASQRGFGMRFNSGGTLDVLTRDASALNNGGNSAAKFTNTLIKTSATYDGVGHVFMAVDGVTTTTTGQSTVNITNNDEVDFFGSTNNGVGGSNYKSNGILKRFAYYASRLKDDFVKRLS